MKTMGSEHTVQLSVVGELDLATADQFALEGQAALTSCSRTTLVIDMSHVTFIDAAGIGALVAIRNHAESGTNVVAVTEPSRCVRRVLDLTGLTGTFLPSSP